MNRETVFVYAIATGCGLAWLWVSLSVGEALVAGLAALGLAVIAWHAIDTIDGVARSHYSPKNKGE